MPDRTDQDNTEARLTPETVLAEVERKMAAP